MAVKLYWEQGEWNDDEQKLYHGNGKEICHVHAEDIRKRLFLLKYWESSNELISDYYEDRTFEDMMYESTDSDPRGAGHDDEFIWYPRSLHGDSFNRGVEGGGTVWYERNYEHSITAFNPLNNTISLGSGYDIVGASTENTCSGSTGMTTYGRFRTGTPVLITGSVGCDGYYTVASRNTSLGVISLTKVTGYGIISDDASGSPKVSCNFGGDLYCTNYNFYWDDVQFTNSDKIFCTNGDRRPPDGGIFSANSNTYWTRTVNPYLYHHWDYNSNRQLRYTHLDKELGVILGIYSWSYPSWYFFPIQTDPKELDEPIFVYGSRSLFPITDKLEIKAHHITQPTKLGPVDNVKSLRAPDAYSGIDVVTDNHWQYTGSQVYMNATQPDKRYLELPWADGAEEAETDSIGTDYEVISDKMKTESQSFCSYQELAEYYISLTPLRGYVSGDAGDEYIYWWSLFNGYTGEWDPLYNDDQSDYPLLTSDFWGCNGAQFEALLYINGDYDYWLDTEYIWIPADVLYAREYWEEHNTGDVQTVSEDPIATIRKTWKWSLGRPKNSPYMIAKEQTIPDFDTYDNSNGGSDNMPIHKWSGLYIKDTKPTAELFRNYYSSYTRGGGGLNIAQGVSNPSNFSVGAYCQFYPLSTSTYDELVDSATVIGVVDDDVYFDKAIPTNCIVQGDTRIHARHDQGFYDGALAYDQVNLILSHIRDVLNQAHYIKLDAGIARKYYSPYSSDPFKSFKTAEDAILFSYEECISQGDMYDPTDPIWDTTPVGEIGYVFFGTQTTGTNIENSGFITNIAVRLVDEGGQPLYALPPNQRVLMKIEAEADSESAAYYWDAREPGDPNIRACQFSFRSRSFNVPDATYTVTGPGMNDFTLSATTVYGWAPLDTSYEYMPFVPEGWDGIITDSNITDNLSGWSIQKTLITISSSSDLAIEMDWDHCEENIWDRDYTKATVYVTQGDPNNPPWPNPPYFHIFPILKGDLGYGIFNVYGAYSDTNGDYFIVKILGSNLEDFKIGRTIKIENTTNWDGDYTISDIEYDYSEIDFKTYHRYKVYVEESISNQDEEYVTKAGDLSLYGYWYIEAEITLCEDLEYNTPLEYRIVSSYPDTTDGNSFTTDWQESRYFEIELGTTEDVHDLFRLNNLHGLNFQPQCRDSLQEATTIDTEICPPKYMTLSTGKIWPGVTPFLTGSTINDLGGGYYSGNIVQYRQFAMYPDLPMNYKFVHETDPTLSQDWSTSYELDFEFYTAASEPEPYYEGWTLYVRNNTGTSIDSQGPVHAIGDALL